jgi:hypothetical protein
MTEQIIGKVMMTFKGDYDDTKQYNFLDTVEYNGSSFVCKANGTHDTPSENSANWQLLAKAGCDGKDGINGKDGAPGKDGVNGKDGAPGKDGKDGAPGKNGKDGAQGDPGFYHYTVDLTDAKYDRNKWYYVASNGNQLGSLGGSSYFSLEAPLYNGIDVPYGVHSSGTGKDACARQAVLYGQGRWGSYDRKLIVLDDDTNLTTDGKRLLTFAVPSDNNLAYSFYARGGLKISIASDVSGLTWTPHTDTYVVNGTTMPVLSDAPDPKSLGLDDDHTFWALPMSQLKQQLQQGPQGLPGKDGVTPHIDSTTGDWFIGNQDTGTQAQGPAGENGRDGADGQPGKDGQNGITPHIDTATGNWFVGSTDTGIKAQGPQGSPGKDGQTPDVSKLTTKTAWSETGITYINGAKAASGSSKLKCRAITIGDVHIVQVKGWLIAGNLGNHNFLPQVQVPAFGFENDDYYFEAKGSVTSYDSFIQVDSKAKCQINLYSYSTQNGPSIPLNAMWIY